MHTHAPVRGHCRRAKQHRTSPQTSPDRARLHGQEEMSPPQRPPVKRVLPPNPSVSRHGMSPPLCRRHFSPSPIRRPPPAKAPITIHTCPHQRRPVNIPSAYVTMCPTCPNHSNLNLNQDNQLSPSEDPANAFPNAYTNPPLEIRSGDASYYSKLTIFQPFVHVPMLIVLIYHFYPGPYCSRRLVWYNSIEIGFTY